jgi:uncharacterized membrane protein
MLPKWLTPAILIVSFAGFLDAGYLAVKHFSGGSINCVVFEGCDKVATSSYALIANIPVALIGVIFYLAVLGLMITYIDTKNHSILKLVAFMAFIGLAASLRFMYLQLFVINAVCTYCLVSAVTSAILFGLGIYSLKTKPEKSSDIL